MIRNKLLGWLTVWLVLSGQALADGPQRIVIAGPALTEIAFLLGAGDRVIAVDKHSVYPPEAKAKAQIGYFRSLAAEPILALSPDAVVATPDAEPNVTFDQLRSTGLAVHMAPDVRSPDAVSAKISFVGEVLGLTAKARELADAFDARLAKLKEAAAGTGKRPRVVFIMGIKGAPVVAGRDTVPHEMITLAGGENAMEAFAGYKPITVEALVGAAPEVLLMMPDRLEAAGGRDALLSRHGLQHTPVGKSKHVVTMDGAQLLRLGPRTAQAIETLAEAFHPLSE